MLISIIIPIYNVEPYILRCLQSVAAQTQTDGLECILVDDRGSDRSMELAENFVKAYDGPISFRILRHEHNAGLSAARNTGIRAVQGKYLYFLDSDDEITPDCIASLRASLEEYGTVDMIQASFVERPVYQSNYASFEAHPFVTDRTTIKQLLLDFMTVPVTAQNRLVRKELIISDSIFFREGIIHEDNHWTFFLAKHVCSLVCSQAKLYHHYKNPGSITTNINRVKEISSARAIMEDFCAHIDPFCRDAQKRLIFYTLSNILSAGYYTSADDRWRLFSLFHKQCSLVQRIPLDLWYRLKPGKLRTKVAHLLLRLFSMEK